MNFSVSSKHSAAILVGIVKKVDQFGENWPGLQRGGFSAIAQHKQDVCFVRSSLLQRSAKGLARSLLGYYLMLFSFVTIVAILLLSIFF